MYIKEYTFKFTKTDLFFLLKFSVMSIFFIVEESL